MENEQSVYLPNPYKLRPFQVEAVEKMKAFLTNGNGVYNSAEQGCGKSIMTIAYMNVMKPARTLIICPAVMRLVWRKELRKFSTTIDGISPWVLESSKGTAHLEAYFTQYDVKSGFVVICSYELASTKYAIDLFKRLKFNLLICDEAHYLKDRKTKRSKAIFSELLPSIPKVIALSGTPITNCVTDFYTWAHALAPKEFPNYYQFANKYAEQQRTPFGVKYHGIRNDKILNPLIRKLFFLRYLKKDVLPELPAKQWIEVPLPETYAVKKLPEIPTVSMQEAAARVADSIQNGVHVKAEDMQLVKSIRQAQGIAKIEPVAQFVANLLEQNIPVVLFAYHKAVITGLYKSLSKFGPVEITGDTTPTKRMQAVEDFQIGRTNLFIGQFTAAGTGITLTRSSNVVLAELDYSPAVISQAVDRVHRIGQADSVNVYYFKVQASIEERIVQVLIEKASSFEKALDGQVRC